MEHVSGVHVGVAISMATSWAGVMVEADQPAIVLDADEARLLAAIIEMAAERADEENNHPEGETP